jgi:hypothetical protein
MNDTARRKIAVAADGKGLVSQAGRYCLLRRLG